MRDTTLRVRARSSRTSAATIDGAAPPEGRLSDAR